MKKIYKFLLTITALATAGSGVYRYIAPDKYQYWKELVAKDPKPEGVSEQEYQEKLRAGYCWRDRKFYRPEELHSKAMVGFAGRLLGEAEAYRTDSTTLQGEASYTGGQCRIHEKEKACSVWFSPQGYTNAQWDQLFLSEDNPSGYWFLARYMDKEIRQPEDLNIYLSEHDNQSFSLIYRWHNNEGAYVYGSDCCRVMDKQTAEPIVEGKEWSGYFELASTFPENNIPEGINPRDYGVGNFYFEFRPVSPRKEAAWGKNEGKTYQSNQATILMMSNCGELLWLPDILYTIQSK